MKDNTKKILDDLLQRLPELAACGEGLLVAYTAWTDCFAAGGKLMACGNGGSAADSEHIVGELMKGFNLKRQLPQADVEMLTGAFPEDGAALAANLQRALPALSLCSHTALTSAFVNDVSPSMAFAQQVYGLGKPGDIVLGISTSGNSANVVNAVKVAKAMGIRTIALVGGDGGKLAALSDVAIIAPAKETYRVQEYHLPVYHALCAMVEEEFFGSC
jgi:D-sedoheptulose 7-phosphate isomerase